MLRHLPCFIIRPIITLLLSLNLVYWGSLIILGGVIKLLLPSQLKFKWSRVLESFMHAWAYINMLVIRCFNPIEFDVQGIEHLNTRNWYLLLANHQSWFDIMLISYLCINKMPAGRYFLKRELLKIPFIGLAAWALDMPLMQRYSKQYLSKYPEKRGCDIATTQKACEKFKFIPVTVINFVEGTRFTKQKHQLKQSPYRHLLPAKAGGIAFALATMGQQFSGILNTTLCYPDNPEGAMHAAACGKLKRLTVRIEFIPITTQHLGDYDNDLAFKQGFQNWLNGLWQKKDIELQKLRDKNQ
ncbi:acyltransferase [Saccharobesus litoralis]|uniref:Acyltransferase n=1 Tax=Saccharobesus litoralis TaxID=2172099 RepID=A0A2S0VXD7_9ALTE|nr:acyltransferase [Saccharobesus litoralis]AWB68780.1 acyltransferase [Saccharobesus litoralis]